MIASLGKYAKAIVAVIGAAAVVVTTLGINQPWAASVVAVATALGVYRVSNKPGPPQPGKPA